MKSVVFFVLFVSACGRPEEEFASTADSTVHSSYSLHHPYAHLPIYYAAIPTDVSPGLMAVAQLIGKSDSSISGTIIFYQPQPPGTVFITGNITGLTNGSHGFHIHRDGDMRNSCDSMGPHYNPFLLQHGGPLDPHRHVGDLGNIVADDNGNVKLQIADDVITLIGPYNIVGRGIVVHEKEDDLGRGGNPESLKTGNAGGRLACGIISHATPVVTST